MDYYVCTTSCCYGYFVFFLCSCQWRKMMMSLRYRSYITPPSTCSVPLGHSEPLCVATRGLEHLNHRCVCLSVCVFVVLVQDHASDVRNANVHSFTHIHTLTHKHTHTCDGHTYKHTPVTDTHTNKHLWRTHIQTHTQPLRSLLSSVGGTSVVLGLVAMASTVDSLYASMKALVCIVGNNQFALKEMERMGGFQVMDRNN